MASACLCLRLFSKVSQRNHCPELRRGNKPAKHDRLRGNLVFRAPFDHFKPRTVRIKLLKSPAIRSDKLRTPFNGCFIIHGDYRLSVCLINEVFGLSANGQQFQRLRGNECCEKNGFDPHTSPIHGLGERKIHV